MTAILGISGLYHDSAAALLVDGELVAAAQEERFTRKKHDARYPRHAVDYVLQEAGLKLNDVAGVVFYDKPFLTFERLLETYLGNAPAGFRSFATSMPVWLREKLFQKDMLLKELRKHDGGLDDEGKLKFTEHHVSHAASAYYPSPFDDAVVLTVDGVGEWATTTVARGKGAALVLEKEIHFPHSLGLLYAAFTYYTGFKVNSGEYKVMGLAPYGVPRFTKQIWDHLIDVQADGSFHLNQDYFDYATGLRMTNEKFAALFGLPVRRADKDPLTQDHMDLAASVQAVTEEVLLRMTRALAKEYKCPNLCMAGGVALNCVANGKILRDGAFQNIWIQPASGDAGGAVGAAYALWHGEMGMPRKKLPKGAMDGMKGAYLGPAFDQKDTEKRLNAMGAVVEVVTQEKMLDVAAKALADGMAVGWHQGRMEFGPRALGGRSILGDPRSPSMQKVLNLKVKYRESFRPFAPSVLAEDVQEWFELDRESPYMLLVADVQKAHRRTMTKAEKALFGIEKLNVPRSSVPAITHVDYSARVQTVHKETNPLYHALLTRFKKRTGCGMVVNTSFNVRGEPIVCTPEDSFRCLMGTELDLLVVGNCLMWKKDQDPALAQDYKNAFELD